MSAPYRCPVCCGKGIVPNNFYLAPGAYWSSTSTAPEKCRSCDGAGVVWPAALADEGERHKGNVRAGEATSGTRADVGEGE